MWFCGKHRPAIAIYRASSSGLDLVLEPKGIRNVKAREREPAILAINSRETPAWRKLCPITICQD